MKGIKVNSKKVGTFLKSLSEPDYCYLRLTLQMVEGLRSLIKRHKLSKEDVCQRFKIKPAKYTDFVKGNINYSLHDMARLNAAFMDLEMEELAKNAPIKIKSEKD